MNHFLAKGKILEGKKLNYLLIKDEDNRTTRTIAYDLNYEIEKILREMYLNKRVIINLNIREMNW